ncbi:DUF4231 domain-containing protein [Marinobacter halodurans]|nr:DUF4231 domain-containing protein [Marinobacter halodurans]
MDQQEYVESRLENQINWYDHKSQNAQLKFKLLRGFEILAATCIPLIAGFGGEVVKVEFVLGVLGALIALSSSLERLNRYQERWTDYRTTCESLKHEKYLFLMGAEPYCDDNAYPLLAQRVESLISKENSRWWRYTKTQPEKINFEPSNH